MENLQKTVIRRLRRVSPGRIVVYLFMLALVAFMALPMVYVIVTAFKPLEELYKFPPQFYVENPTVNNFFDLFSSLESADTPFVRYLFNSVLVTVLIVILTTLVCSMGAFGLVKHTPPGASVISGIVVASLMVVPQVTTIPTFMIVNGLGLMDTFWALVLPKVAVAFNFFLVQQFMGQVPNSLLESARLDGATELGVFFRIIMPMLRPVISTLVMFSFTSAWNDYFSALVYTTKDSMKTLPLALQSIAGGVGSAALARSGAVAASSFLMVLPVVIVFLLMQRKVIETMAYSGIK
ncbi:MAG: carbohydrate ABC transporter permease [Clostridia bacterium]|nr:carbohydrate ABC transporter permease [Clostridia bacterium]